MFADGDGCVRAVKLKTQQGEYVQPITRICLLETTEDLQKARHSSGAEPNEEEEDGATKTKAVDDCLT